MAKYRGGRDTFRCAGRKRKSKKSQGMTGLTIKAAKKERIKKRWARYKNKRRPPSHTLVAEGKLVLPKAEYSRIRPNAIRMRPDQEVVDPDVVSSIAESFVITGQVHPVIVRTVGLNVELIWGADVVAAAKAAELEVIEIQHFQGTDEEARLLQIAEPLFRKQLTALERAEHWAEWADGVLKVKGLYSGQPVPKRGRPEGDILKAARLLPAYGLRTFEGRKKMLQRAYKIDRLSSDVKQAIKKVGLDDNQSALLVIASASSTEEQNRIVQQFAKKLSEVPKVKSPPLQPTTSPSDSEDEGDRHEKTGTGAQTDEEDDGDDDADRSADDEEDSEATDEGGDDDASEEPKAPPDTNLKQLRDFMKEHGGTKLWVYTPMTVRKEFIDWLASRPCRANSDVEPYVKDVFAGREKIESRVLKAHATSKGLSEKQVLTYLKLHGYTRVKTNGDPGAPWVYQNPDPNFARKVSSITKAELEAPHEARIKAQADGESRQTASNLDSRNGAKDYYHID